MNSVDRVLLEQYVSFKGITFEEGMKYLKIILNTRDFTNPIIKNDNFINNDLVIINFDRQKDYVYASGAYSLNNGEFNENRSFMMRIYDDGESIKTISEVDRLGKVEGIKKYFMIEKFVKRNNCYNRYSIYDDGKSLKEYKRMGMVLDNKELERFIFNKTSQQKKVLV